GATVPAADRPTRPCHGLAGCILRARPVLASARRRLAARHPRNPRGFHRQTEGFALRRRQIFRPFEQRQPRDAIAVFSQKRICQLGPRLRDFAQHPANGLAYEELTLVEHRFSESRPEREISAPARTASCSARSAVRRTQKSSSFAHTRRRFRARGPRAMTSPITFGAIQSTYAQL